MIGKSTLPRFCLSWGVIEAGSLTTAGGWRSGVSSRGAGPRDPAKVLPMMTRSIVLSCVPAGTSVTSASPKSLPTELAAASEPSTAGS
jgi:hypothetical protein